MADMQASQADSKPLQNRVGALERVVDSLSNQLRIATIKLQKLTAIDIATIDTLHAKNKWQAELNKTALDKYVQHVRLLHFLLVSQQFFTWRVSDRVHVLECAG